MRANAPWRETVPVRTIYWVMGIFTIAYPAVLIVAGAYIQKVWSIF